MGWKPFLFQAFEPSVADSMNGMSQEAGTYYDILEVQGMVHILDIWVLGEHKITGVEGLIKKQALTPFSFFSFLWGGSSMLSLLSR